MDPISQGLVGAVFSGSTSNKKELQKAVIIGFGAGMLADIDILIRSSTDPLIAVEYHRQFTHSLIFIPFGALIAALIFRLIFRKKIKFKQIYLYSLVGYATHCFLDASTTYGTEIFWPFSDMRISLSSISVIDPFFTFVLAAIVIIGYKKKSLNISRIGILFCISYLLFGSYQHYRAEKFLLNAAALRGHNVEKIIVHPTLGNLILWRGIYQSGDKFYVDAVRTGLFSNDKLYQGNSIKKFDINSSISGIENNSVLSNDIKRFSHFTNDFLVISPGTKNVIGDLRYSALPNGIQPLWGIKIDNENQEQHVEFTNTLGINNDKRTIFINMIMGEDTP